MKLIKVWTDVFIKFINEELLLANLLLNLKSRKFMLPLHEKNNDDLQ
jgi:hypothetical protein